MTFIRKETQLALMGSAVDNLPDYKSLSLLSDAAVELYRKLFNLLKENQGQASALMLTNAMVFYFNEEEGKYIVKDIFKENGTAGQKITYAVLSTFLQTDDPIEIIEETLKYYRHEVPMSDMRLRLKTFFGNPKMAAFYSRRDNII